MMTRAGHHGSGSAAAGDANAAREALNARPPRVIVIGGSAGGLEALLAVLPAFPGSLGVPVLVVLHLAVESRSDWSVIFDGSALAVREAEDKDPAEPGNVYLAPPNYHMLVDRDGQLQLSVDPRVHYARPAIDVLFESAAWAYGANVLGVVLSGANTDGAIGLSAIARAGGHAWVQAPETAIASLMPRAALESTKGAYALGLGEMTEIIRSGVLPRSMHV